jgi:hypothetical protein
VISLNTSVSLFCVAGQDASMKERQRRPRYYRPGVVGVGSTAEELDQGPERRLRVRMKKASYILPGRRGSLSFTPTFLPGDVSWTQNSDEIYQGQHSDLSTITFGLDGANRSIRKQAARFKSP